MIIRNGIRSNLRSRGRTALFAGMILVLTLAMILALGVRLYSDAALARCDQLYRSIAMVEYMGAEYPDQDDDGKKYQRNQVPFSLMTDPSWKSDTFCYHDHHKVPATCNTPLLWK